MDSAREKFFVLRKILYFTILEVYCPFLVLMHSKLDLQ